MSDQAEAARQEYAAAAAGWGKWQHVVDGEQAGARLSAKIVELASLGPGGSALDVGGGYGEPSLTAAKAVGPTGRVVCTDLSAEMLAVGRSRAQEAGLENIEFVECEASQLDFPAQSFDAVISRFSLMFLPDLAGMLSRFHEFLKVRGRLAAAVWSEQQKVGLATGFTVILQEVGMPIPPPGSPGPFALSDRTKLGMLFAEVGFRDVETGTIDVVFETETPEVFTTFVRDFNPRLSQLIADRTADEQERIWQKVTDAYGRLVEADGRVRAHSEAIWIVGSR